MHWLSISASDNFLWPVKRTDEDYYKRKSNNWLEFLTSLSTFLLVHIIV